MQVTETLSQGLKREFKVTIDADSLAKRVDEEIEALKGKVHSTASAPARSRPRTSSACTASR